MATSKQGSPCKLVVYGNIDSGTTSVIELILGDRPLQCNRMSTPSMFCPRPIITYKVNLDGNECAKVTTLKEHKDFLAKTLIHPNVVHSILANQQKDSWNQPASTTDILQASSDQIGTLSGSQPLKALLEPIDHDLEKSNLEVSDNCKRFSWTRLNLVYTRRENQRLMIRNCR